MFYFTAANWPLPRVANSHRFNADPDQDPDPAFNFNADLYPAFHLNGDPDPVPHQRDVNLRLLVCRPSRAPFLF